MSLKSFGLMVLLALISTALHLATWQFENHTPRGDEIRYLEQANLLLADQPMYDHNVIFNPPLYPAFLASMMKLGVPESLLNISGIVLSVLSCLLLFHALLYLCTLGWAFTIALIFCVYPPLVLLGTQLMTEVPTSFLAILAAWLLIQYSRTQTLGWLKLAGVSIAFAAFAMMKPILGYALLLSIPVTLFILIFSSAAARAFLWRAIAVAVFSLLLCSPYLLYTYEKTGDYFSWGTTGGELLYWMTVNDEDVWGSWIPLDEAESNQYMVDNGHAAVIAHAESLDGLEAGDYYLSLFKRRLIENPKNYVVNVFANIGRLLFNQPYTLRSQSLFTYAYIFPNMLIFFLLLLGIVLLPLTIRRQPVALLWYLGLIVIYFGGNTLIATTGRQALPFIGPFIIWLCCQYKILLTMGIINPHARH